MAYGFKTILVLGKEEHELKAFSYSFDKDINEKGDVTGQLQGGVLFLSLDNLPTRSILEWGMKHRLYKDGMIQVVNLEDDVPIESEEINFEHAACINLKIVYEADGTGYFTTLLTISPRDICVGRSNCWINKNWK